jgi:hypothetical protein
VSARERVGKRRAAEERQEKGEMVRGGWSEERREEARTSLALTLPLAMFLLKMSCAITVCSLVVVRPNLSNLMSNHL